MNFERNAVPNRTAAFPTRWAAFFAIAILAIAIRLPQLSARPMHSDEAINAYIIGELLDGEGYHYDPQDRHGPVLYAVAQPLVKLFGRYTYPDLTEWQLRLTPVIIGSATILLFGFGVEMFGFVACFVAAILFAIAPLPVYYNRYFIHETLFVAATFGLILSGGRMFGWDGRPVEGRRRLVPAALVGLCAALMLACKETAVIHFFALLVVLVCAWFLPPRGKFPALKLVAIAFFVFIFVTILLFTWFGRNWSVFSDLLHAVPSFTARAGGEGHEKPFDYYFHLLDPMFVLFIVAAAGVYAAICDAVSCTRKPPLLLVIYGLVIFLIYSAIPYKTPWLALNLWLPLSLACGLGVAAFWEHIKHATGRWVAGIAGAFLLGALGMQTKSLAFDHPADETNPFAYAHTGEDLLGLPPRLKDLVTLNNLTQPRIAVIAADAWPLPWYLRKFSNVGYWQPGQETGPADFFITIGDLPDKLKAQLKDFRPEYFGVRPGLLMVLWVPPKTKMVP